MSEHSAKKSHYQQLIDNWADMSDLDPDFIGYLVVTLATGKHLTQADLIHAYFEIRSSSRLQESNLHLRSTDERVHKWGEHALNEVEERDLAALPDADKEVLRIALKGEAPKYLHLQALADVYGDFDKLRFATLYKDIGKLVMKKWYPHFSEMIAAYKEIPLL